jgi:hypothetical protein
LAKKIRYFRTQKLFLSSDPGSGKSLSRILDPKVKKKPPDSGSLTHTGYDAQGREGLISWVQEVLLEACRVKMYPTSIIPESSHVPHEPIPFYCNQARQSIPLVPYNRMQDQVSKQCFFLNEIKGTWQRGGFSGVFA